MRSCDGGMHATLLLNEDVIYREIQEPCRANSASTFGNDYLQLCTISKILLV